MLGGKEAERVHHGDTASKDQGPMVPLVLDGRYMGIETEWSRAIWTGHL